MNLYYFPGACSLASHITVNELGLPVELIRVDLATKLTEDAEDFRSINPEGYVPALQLDDGSVMTESPAILQFLSDSVRETTLTAPVGSVARYRIVEMIAFVSTEIHQSLGPLVMPGASPEAKQAATAKIRARLERLERVLAKQPYLAGEDFTIADAYAFAILGAVRHFGVDFSGLEQVQALLGRVAQRESVQLAMQREGLQQQQS